MSRPGVLLMSFGAVESVDDLAQYYTNIRGGHSPAPDQLADLRTRYERIGGRSPLVPIMRRQAQKLESRLSASEPTVPVRIGMRFWNPTIADGVRALHEQDVGRIIAVTSGPYDSRLSVGSYDKQLQDAVAKVDPTLEIDLVRCWYDVPLLERAWARAYQSALESADWTPETTYVLFSAHSLPERILAWDDPYPGQFFDHGRALARYLNLPRWGFCYQSAGLTSEPWLGPDILPALEHVKGLGAQRVLNLPIGFSADHLEIKHDLDYEARRRAEELGLQWARAASLNDSDEFIRTLAEIVGPRLSSDGPYYSNMAST